MLRCLIVVFAFLFTGCDQEALLQKFIPQAEAEEGKKILAQLAAKQFDLLEGRLDPALNEPDARRKLGELATLIPPGPPKSIVVIGSHTVKRETDTDYNLTYEYEYDSGWLIQYVLLQRKAGKLVLSGLQVVPQPQSQKAANAFTFAGKGALHYVGIALAGVIPLLVILALVLCFRAKGLQKKWLWLLFISVGVVQVSLNWTSGEINVQPLSVLLLGAGFSRAGPYGPMVIALAVPLGALVFLARRRSLQATVHSQRTGPPEGQPEE